MDDVYESAPVVQPGPPSEFPRMVYRRGGKKGQIDVPGNDFMVVADGTALAQAIADGWQMEPVAADAPEPVAEPEPARKGRK